MADVIEIRYRDCCYPRGVVWLRPGPVEYDADGYPAWDGQLAVLYESERSPGSMTLHPMPPDRDPAGFAYFPVPDWLRAAFRAGEDWRPVVDWLLETYPDRLGWFTAATEAA